MMQELVKSLKTKGLTIASIESLTGGMFASLMSSVPGASSVFKGSLVSYQTIVKEEVLHVDKTIIDAYGVISMECAKAMAIQGEKMFQSDIVVSCTGNAGPDAMDGKAVGFVCMGILVHDKISTYEVTFDGNRASIRLQVCEFLKEKVLEIINN